MNGPLSPTMLRILQVSACVVVLMWGIRTASHLLLLLLMAVVFAYAFAPLPKWLMEHLHLGKTAALASTVALLGTLNVLTVILLYDSVVRMKERLPVYHEHFMALFDKVLVFASAHGVTVASLSATKTSTSEHILEFARMALTQAGGFLADGLLISVLAWIFLIKMTEEEGAKKNRLSEVLAYYGGDVQHYIGISSKTGLATALANLVVLLVLGVDFPVVWCALYFFLHFIPNVGFIFALVPPTFAALLMLGWQKALLVCGALIITQMLTDYGLTPILMKKAVDVSFLEITVSLMVWSFLLGPAGAILGIPLTLALRRFIEQLATREEVDEHAPGVTSATTPAVEAGALEAG
jgi:AI-2 transport protein TqsA